MTTIRTRRRNSDLANQAMAERCRVLDNTERGIIKKAITRHAGWPRYARANRMTSSQISSSEQIHHICRTIGLDIGETLSAAYHENETAAFRDIGKGATQATTAQETAASTTDSATAQAPVSVDWDKVREIAKQEADARIPDVRIVERLIIATESKRYAVDEEIYHHQFPMLVQMLSQNINVYLAGEASSGKTTAVEHAAKALGRPFLFQSVCCEPFEITGYLDASSNYVTTAFVRAFEEGAVMLLDEIDAESYAPGALLAINTALEQGYMSLPGGRIIHQHPDFVCCAAGNTFGFGADSDYNARNALDAATLSRFTGKLRWDCDNNFERKLAAMLTNDNAQAAAWLEEVQVVRALVKKMALPRVCDFRTWREGWKLIDAGVSVRDVREVTYLPQLDSDQRLELESGRDAAIAALS